MGWNHQPDKLLYGSIKTKQYKLETYITPQNLEDGLPVDGSVVNDHG